MQQQRGFTLVEICIVLVVIGLLLGGILKGQELINSAKVKNLAQDFRSVPTLIYAYQDKFRALPGDDGRAVSHLCPNAAACTTAGNANGAIDGNWDDPIGSGSEALLFWQHVRLARLATGASTPGDANYLPLNSEGGRLGVQSGGATAPLGLAGGYIMCSAGIQGKFILQLDETLDDGDPATGTFRAGPAGGAATTTSAIDPGAAYVGCLGL